MITKKQPLGICDHCLGPIHPGSWYTTKGQPRLYCSRDCRNTANSRAGAAIRSAKQRDHIARGEWQNPAVLHPPNPEIVSAGIRRARLIEVQEGRWRNPGLTSEAREINSRPHKHSGHLASAIEKLKAGHRVADLTPEERDAHCAYRRDQQKAWKASMGETEKEKRREQFRRSWQKRHPKKARLIEQLS